MDIEWVDELPKSAREADPAEAEFAAAVKENAGARWAKFKEFEDGNRAHHLAGTISKGNRKAFREPGFEAKARKLPNSFAANSVEGTPRYAVFVRFTG